MTVESTPSNNSVKLDTIDSGHSLLDILMAEYSMPLVPTCHEMKNMMRQTIGCLVGLCPPEGISFVRDYLHIHRLSHWWGALLWAMDQL
jgi:hypothetical protein